MERNASIPAVCIAASNECSPCLQLCDATGLETLSQRECFNIQAYVIPEVNEVWTTETEGIHTVYDVPL